MTGSASCELLRRDSYNESDLSGVSSSQQEFPDPTKRSHVKNFHVLTMLIKIIPAGQYNHARHVESYGGIRWEHENAIRGETLRPKSVECGRQGKDGEGVRWDCLHWSPTLR